MGPDQLALMIPILAIAGAYVVKIYRMTLEHGNSADKKLVTGLERRVAELENRVLTLQDIVISGDYERQRRLKQHEAEAMHAPIQASPPIQASAPTTQPPPRQTLGEG